MISGLPKNDASAAKLQAAIDGLNPFDFRAAEKPEMERMDYAVRTGLNPFDFRAAEKLRGAYGEGVESDVSIPLISGLPKNEKVSELLILVRSQSL